MMKQLSSGHGQIAMIWWGLAFMTIYAISLIFLLHMVPPPAATLSPGEVAAFYRENSLSIRLGAVICSWTGAFMVPIATVLAIQLARLQEGVPSWAILSFAGGIMMSIFLVLPPLFWGVAAYTTDRAPEVTTLMHEYAMLTLVTTDQYFIFQMVPLGFVSLVLKQHDALSAFPRWVGYVTLWIALAFEAGALAFLPRSGPFSWTGLFVFWIPLTSFGVWVAVISFSMHRAIKRQQAAQGP